MLRHKRNKHRPQRESEDTGGSPSESELSEHETTESDTDGGMSDADEASDVKLSSRGHREEEEEEDPWDSVMQKAFDKCQDQFERGVAQLLQSTDIGETEARKRVYLDMRSTYRKAASGVFTERMLWFHAIRKQAVYKAIKKTANNFVDLDDYGLDEAWKSAVGQRKYLFDTILVQYNPPDIEGGEEDSSEDEGPSGKRAKV